jgi:inhibitor of cysteine peptidase
MYQPSTRRRATGIALAVVTVVALALLAGCGSESTAGGDADGTTTTSGAATPETFTPKDGDTLDVAAGSQFVVALESNPTTGYEWTVASIDGAATMVKSQYVAPKGNAMGAAGTQRLTFAAGPAGTSTVHLVYARSFAPDEPGQQLTFTVDAQG